jgi:hypothetical protein
MTRKEIHNMFVSTYNHKSGSTVPTVNMSDIIRMERELNTRLPQAYIEFMLDHGEAYTPSILSLIVERNIQMDEIKNIESIQEAIIGTKSYWEGGAPKDLIGFGGDHCGNMFSFKRHLAGNKRPDDLPVWYFDYEFLDTSEVAPSFDGFLLAYLKLKYPEIS